MLIKCVALSSLFALAQAVIYKNMTEGSILQLRCTYENECAEDDIIIQGEEGYKILVTVTRADIDGGNGDFFLIKSGTRMDDDYTGRIFSYHITEARELLSLTENVFVRFAINGDDKENYTGFTLTAQYYGDQITTPEPTTTDIPWPTTSDEETPYITVNMTITEFNSDTIQTFINTVIEMATDYVTSQTDFELSEEISADNVHINKVTQCPNYWLNRDSCFQFTFAVPLLLVEDSEHYGSYQLNETHLLTMWQNASQYFENSNDSSLNLYQTPNNMRVIVVWVSIIGSVALLFGIFYLVTGYQCTGYIMKKKKHALLENHSESLSDDGRKSSASSLTPHPLQTVPPLFDSDMPYFEPDSPPFFRPSGMDNSNELRGRERQFIFGRQSLREVKDQ